MMLARISLVMLLACATTASATGVDHGYGVVARIPGGDGGWDYATVDPAGNRLFVAHGDTVATVDLAKPDAVTTLAPARHAHAVLPIPGSTDVLVTEGDTATVRLIDGATGIVRATIAVGQKPDAAIWDARRHRAVVMNAKSGTVMMIDPATARITATITLAPNLEFAAFDKRGRLFVNDESMNTVFVIDADAGTVVGRIALPGCDGPTGMAYAPKADRIVSACANKRASVIDPVARRQVATLPIGDGPDAVIADPGRDRLFIPAGNDGTLTILADGKAGVNRIGMAKTEIGARTGAVDPQTGTLYLPSAALGARTTGAKRGAPLPGTFHILVVKPGA